MSQSSQAERSVSRVPQAASEFDPAFHASHENVCGEGYSLDLFSPDAPPPEELLCPVCEGVARYPVQTDCGHVFCHCCALRWWERRRGTAEQPLCPLDQSPLDIARCVLLLRDMRRIRALPACCPACGEALQLGAYDAHAADACAARTVACSVCDEAMPARDLDAHVTARAAHHVQELGERLGDALVAQARQREAVSALEEQVASLSMRLEAVQRWAQFRMVYEPGRFSGSRVLDAALAQQLTELHGGAPRRWRLIYCGSVHGLTPANFHRHCDAARGTMTVVRAANGFVFGGFTARSWKPEREYGDWREDTSAYLYSLVNAHNKRLRLRVRAGKANTAIYCSRFYGPSFGYAGQLRLQSRMSVGYSHRLGTYQSTYELDCDADGVVVDDTLLAGAGKFEIDEIEVFDWIEDDDDGDDRKEAAALHKT